MEELLSQIKYLSKISEPERKKQIGVLVRKLTNLLSFNQVWEEFEKWFTKIHSGFIESLRSKHSNLSITEIKVCALLRLNMNSKEIASLMNIQPESVSMSRYRIRKKLALPRKQNLNEYLSQF
jgi:DNA-binding CsgD family transcriptional regulator